MSIDQTLESSPEAGNLLVFVHIPKTAGTTLNGILAHHYPADAVHEIMMRGMSLIVPKQSMIATPLVSPSKLRRLKSALGRSHAPRVIHGHLDMSLDESLPAGAQYITLLRDPVERAISHYFHYRRRSADPVHPLAMQSTLAEWVSTCGLVEMDNGQTRRLAGEMGLAVGEVTSRMLDKAKANLAGRFAVVGLTERFDETQVLLHRTFNWPYWRYPARNIDDHRQWRAEVSRRSMEIVEECNRFDLDLYRFASTLFEQAVGKLNMDRELQLLRNAPEYAAPARADSALQYAPA